MKNLLYAVMILLMWSPASRLHAADNGLTLEFRYEIPSVCTEITMTSRHDIAGRAILYVAAKDGGLKIYDISAAPTLLQTIGISALGGLHVMNLSQRGTNLYLALGNHFSTPGQTAGMAIIDVTNPSAAMVKALWVDQTSNSGGGIVETDGNYAYLGAMGSGVVILDISQQGTIGFVSRIIPHRNFPVAKFDSLKINARGMVVSGNIIYLCYDAGGVRIINTTDKKNPRETGKYSNPALDAKPRAYNNVALNGRYLYVTADYCGMEILDISDTSNIKQAGWWNPWKCHTDDPFNLKWFGSAGHANEIALDTAHNLAFLSTGKSDLYAVSVVNPAAPDSVGIYGGIDNGLGTWGISRSDQELYLTYICTLGIPFASNWTGVKTLRYSVGTMAAEGEDVPSEQISIIRNEGGSLRIEIPANHNRAEATISNVIGQVVARYTLAIGGGAEEIPLPSLSGVYIIAVSADGLKRRSLMFYVP